MLVKLWCKKEKYMFIRGENKGKPLTGRVVVYLMVSCIGKRDWSRINSYFTADREMGLSQSPVLWEPEEHKVRMLAVSPEV